ncbi:MAG: WecB/TagA/CpsF family glycosyltransferase, partial [Synergistales bacterium]|nr:WecB/TagA/CpsF family glycosyltransferase [Synergistales bacterium]
NYAISKARGLITNPEKNTAQLIVTLNAIGMEETVKDKEFFEVVKNSSMNLADGFGLCLGMKILGMPVQERVAGIDFAEQLCRAASVEGWPVYFCGAAGNTSKECAEILKEKFPGLIVAGARDGYFDINNAEIADEIAKSGAKILLAAMGQPRQEKFIYIHRKILGPMLCIGVGGAFDVLSGKLNRAPLWVQKIGFEWLYRMLQEPMRWRKNLSLITFVVRIFASKIGIYKS